MILEVFSQVFQFIQQPAVLSVVFPYIFLFLTIGIGKSIIENTKSKSAHFYFGQDACLSAIVGLCAYVANLVNEIALCRKSVKLFFQANLVKCPFDPDKIGQIPDNCTVKGMNLNFSDFSCPLEPSYVTIVFAIAFYFIFMIIIINLHRLVKSNQLKEDTYFFLGENAIGLFAWISSALIALSFTGRG